MKRAITLSAVLLAAGVAWASFPSSRVDSAGSECNERRINWIGGLGITIGQSDDIVLGEQRRLLRL
jgi:hypothetical protein